RDHLDHVAELGGQRAERVLVEGLRGRGHLAQVEEHGHERRGVRVDLVREVVQRGAVAQAHHRRAVAARDLHAAERRRLHGLELLALRPARLATAYRLAAGAPEGTLRRTTTTGATARAAEATTTGTARGTGTAATGTTATTGAATTAARRRAVTRTGHGGPARHHARVRTRAAATGTRRGRARTTRTGAAGPLAAPLGALGPLPRTGHALAGRERVVARTRRAATLAVAATRTAATATGTRHALARGERVVARTRRAATRTVAGTRTATTVTRGAGRCGTRLGSARLRGRSRLRGTRLRGCCGLRRGRRRSLRLLGGGSGRRCLLRGLGLRRPRSRGGCGCRR